MYRQLMQKLRSEISGDVALDFVHGISLFHRIQASPGFRDAAAYCRQKLAAFGMEAHIRQYAADARTAYWGCRSFLEWSCESARLTLIEPQQAILADFHECPISLIQRSTATPAGGVEASVVLVNDAENPQAYEAADLKGKIVFATGDVNKIRRLAAKRGAIGMITDQMMEFEVVRSRMDLPDARQYTSFWGIPEDPDFFGFVLSPRQGERFRQALSAPGATVRVKAHVNSSTYPGKYEVVDAVIPGSSGQEVWCVAHLCHPKPSANDNASGAGALLEAARALSVLIKRGELSEPKRTIRFLLLPEMTGTYCYASENESLLPSVVAAVNLDMVGENQDLCKGPFIVEKPPRAIGSFTGELMAHMLDSLAQEVPNLANTGKYALFKHTVSPFSGGSDHYILSDPSVGVPCPMLIQWPDKFYHTSADTIDKVDPAMLAKVSVLTATYLYFAANAGFSECGFMASVLAEDFSRELARLVENVLGNLLEDTSSVPYAIHRFERRVDFLLERRLVDLASLGKLVSPTEQAALESVLSTLGKDLKALAAEKKRGFKNLLSGLGVSYSDDVAMTSQPSAYDDIAKSIVPKRKFRGPVETRGYIEYLPASALSEWAEYVRVNKAAKRLGTYMLYWADGTRSLAEIADMIEMEVGVRDVEGLVKYYGLLKECGLIS